MVNTLVIVAPLTARFDETNRSACDSARGVRLTASMETIENALLRKSAQPHRSRKARKKRINGNAPSVRFVIGLKPQPAELHYLNFVSGLKFILPPQESCEALLRIALIFCILRALSDCTH